jgi:hypothetical protein
MMFEKYFDQYHVAHLNVYYEWPSTTITPLIKTLQTVRLFACINF